MKEKNNLKVEYINVDELTPAEYNPRKHNERKSQELTESIKRFGLVDPIVCNNRKDRKNVVIGGNFRLKIAKKMGYTKIPVVYVTISDIEKEKELNARLNKNVGDWDFEMLAEYDESFLEDVGFTSSELDKIFGLDENPSEFDLEKELEKLDIEEVTVEKGDVYKLGDHRLMCGDSTNEEDVLYLMDGTKADMCLVDPPYILDYLHGKKRDGNPTEGFGYKRDRKYLETDELPDDFTELWMTNVKKVAKKDFHIMVFENWKNTRTIWNEMEKRWKVKNMIIWRLPNRVQGFSAKYKFFNKYDISMLGAEGQKGLNLEDEDQLLQNEYETALYAIQGKPHWEPYKKGNKYCPTDFIDYVADDEKSSGQGVIFGTKPIEILIPYIKVLTERNDVVIDLFGGSGSTLIACEKMNRNCRMMEKVPAYMEVIIKRWETETGQKAEKLSNKNHE